MLKMYQQHSHSGSSPELWEENWNTAEFDQSFDFCQVDPLRQLFEKYAKKGSLMLEGGCGMGQYVAYYTLKGVSVVGLDFAQRALDRLNKRIPGLPLCAGNVANLPFSDESFDVYYSGGVVEHFESGAEDSLSEAYRVLKKDGILLISVPYFNPLRRVLFPFRKKGDWRKVKEAKVEGKTENGSVFFQYAYKSQEFSKMLEAVGFEIVEKRGYAVLWGLYELPFIARKNEVHAAEVDQKTTVEKQANLRPPVIKESGSPSLLKRLIVSEDSSLPVLGLGVRLMRWAVGNMMMYVCIRK